MSRAVVPWTWARALREYGPKCRDFLLAMLVLRTYMNDAGSTFVGLRLWAAGARMAVNTLQKHKAKAEAEGWLHIASKAGRSAQRCRTEYRCTVPDHIEITEKDEYIAGAIIAKHGDPVAHGGDTSKGERLPVARGRKLTRYERMTEALNRACEPDSVSTLTDTDSVPPKSSVSANGDTDGKSSTAMHSGSVISGESVSNQSPICVNSPGHLYQTPGQSVSLSGVIPKSSSEVPTEVIYEGAGASARTVARVNKNWERKKPKTRELTDAELADRITKLRDAGAATTIDEVLKQLASFDGITRERVLSVIQQYHIRAPHRPDAEQDQRMQIP